MIGALGLLTNLKEGRNQKKAEEMGREGIEGDGKVIIQIYVGIFFSVLQSTYTKIESR